MKINVENFNVTFSDNHILKNINLKIPKNTVTALIGPSGCGKSTFLRSINRMNDLSEDFSHCGKIYVDGEDIYGDDIDVVDLRKKVGMVFQRANPFPMSIFENVAYGLKIHGMKDKCKISSIVKRSLKQAALWDEVKDKLKSSALSLSGGQQQRLCIARTIAINPEVILMDEPCSALDPISTLKIEELINELKKDYTIVLVTHNMQQAKRASDYTSFFLDGEIVESGLTGDIFENPKKEKTDEYISGRFG
ncbi:phosphate ABC transporter ATP-binding protein PstB [Methanobrevibacter sp.]|uniref:phosphate ABC transporter ATP-binding protein PstB n=1 Tax=Methanobrevibacter sp. TaxID=66852 RepID=UPI0026DEC30D|nr:phosphate ABC transporter ATP-binding protein PstB [Methanobrevibacter sp.]MDO5859949.1 phosphate ABC transporter ATP-binding protein PstB [Methanobrevibacter sp.]